MKRSRVQWSKPVSRVLYPNKRAAIIRLGRRLPGGSSDLPGNAVLPKQNFERAAQKAVPYLVLHHEEFTWPHMLPRTPVSSYLTVSPITSYEAGIFSVALVVIRFHGRPDVIRLAALWCSDFPLFRRKATAQPAPCTAHEV